MKIEQVPANVGKPKNLLDGLFDAAIENKKTKKDGVKGFEQSFIENFEKAKHKNGVLDKGHQAKLQAKQEIPLIIEPKSQNKKEIKKDNNDIKNENPVKQKEKKPLVNEKTNAKEMNTYMEALLVIQHQVKNGQMVEKTHEPKAKEISIRLQPDEGKRSQKLHQMKMEKQIHVLQTIARELSALEKDSSSKTKPALKGKEEGKAFIAMIQLQSAPVPKQEETSEIHRLLTSMNVEKKSPAKGTPESKERKTENTKKEFQLDALISNEKQEHTIKQDSVKVQTVQEVKGVLKKEIEQYVDMKMVGNKKIVLFINEENVGKIEIQVEKRDDKIHILLKLEEKTPQEKIENMLEQLKSNLREKEIDVEYELEKEQGEPQEKRKEQEDEMKKEKNREQENANEKGTIKFEELIGVD